MLNWGFTPRPLMMIVLMRFRIRNQGYKRKCFLTQLPSRVPAQRCSPQLVPGWSPRSSPAVTPAWRGLRGWVETWWACNSQLRYKKFHRSRKMFGSKTEVRNSCFKFKCCVLCLNERKDDGNEKRETNQQKEDTSDGGRAEEEQKEARVERVSTGGGGQGKEEEDGGRKFNNVIIVVKNRNYGDIFRILSLNVILKFVFYKFTTFSDLF